MTTVMGDSTAMPYVAAIGVQWGVLDKVVQTPLTYGVPVWVTEHKCGNYPFYASGRPATATTSGHHALRGTATERSVLWRGDLVVHPRRDHQGQGHRVQRAAHGAGHCRQGQRHHPPVGAGLAADGQRRKDHQDAGLLRRPPLLTVRRPRRHGRGERAAGTRWPSRTQTALWWPSSTAPRPGATTSSRSAARSCNSLSLPADGRPSSTSRKATTTNVIAHASTLCRAGRRASTPW